MSEFLKTGVIGHPVRHSKSPLIHNYWIKKYRVKGSYEALDIAPENLKTGLQGLAALGYQGFNLTIPHKENARDICDSIDDLAKAIGAVNTIKIEAGNLTGTNTDSFGFVENIKDTVPSFNFASGPAVVLGAGGAARAVVHGLLQAGAPEILLCNRTKEKAEKLAEMNKAIKVVDWQDAGNVLKEARILVNATSLGMQGGEPLELDLKHLPQETLVNDIVYAPLYTDLLKAAEAQGNPVVTGIGMLLHQARPAFESWYGVSPAVDEELRRLVLQ